MQSLFIYEIQHHLNKKNLRSENHENAIIQLNN